MPVGRLAFYWHHYVEMAIDLGQFMQVKAVSEEIGVGFAGIGFQPKWPVDAIPIMPKARYDIMRNYMPKVGTYGLDMMFRTCTVQVNLDFESEVDMIRKFQVGLALQPIATALFANSPFTEGKPNGYLSFRSQIWTDVDNNRTGDLPFVFDDDFGYGQCNYFDGHILLNSE
jgi:glutamate--cysteine ligase